MVFHGDYEIQFEIFEYPGNNKERKHLGHMPGVNAQDAKFRWVESHQVSADRYDKIFAIYPTERWKYR